MDTLHIKKVMCLMLGLFSRMTSIESWFSLKEIEEIEDIESKEDSKRWFLIENFLPIPDDT